MRSTLRTDRPVHAFLHTHLLSAVVLALVAACGGDSDPPGSTPPPTDEDTGGDTSPGDTTPDDTEPADAPVPDDAMPDAPVPDTAPPDADVIPDDVPPDANDDTDVEGDTVEGDTVEGDTVDEDVATCTTDDDCDDGDVCNGDETCDMASGRCVVGEALVCDAIDTCHEASCDAATGCVQTVIDEAGLPRWWADCDEDGFGAPALGDVEACDAPAEPPELCGEGGAWVAADDEAVDCCDRSDQYYPGSMSWISAIPTGGEVFLCEDFDSNCNGAEQREITVQFNGNPPACTLNAGVCSGLAGWNNTTPACGDAGPYSTCSLVGGNCLRLTQNLRSQRCR